MAERKAKRTSIFRRNTIFSKTFFGVLLFSVGMIVLFYAVMNWTMVKHHREQLGTASLNMLHQASESMDLTVEVLAQEMTQVLWSSDFVDYMINPLMVVQERDYRLIRQLKSCADGNGLIKKVFFYSPISKKIYQNIYSIESADEFEDWYILDKYFETSHSMQTNETRTRTELMNYADRLFLIQDLDIASHIGTLVYELDKEALSDRLFENGESAILVYDNTYTRAFVQNGDESIPWSDPDLFLTYENADDQMATQVSGYYRYVSNYNGWNYLLPIDSAGLSISFQQVVLSYFPIFLISLVVGIGFAWYISRTIYRPINRLMHLVSHPEEKKGRPQVNEADFLEDVYSHAMANSAHLQQMMSSIAPEVLEAMLKNLLVGKHLSEKRVVEILEGVGTPFSLYSRSFVLVCQIEEPKEREIDDTEVNLYLLAIRNLASRLSDDVCRVYDVRTEKLTVALIFCFEEQHPIVSVKRKFAEAQKILQTNVEVLPFGLLCERGNIYQNILDIRYSYQEAVEKIQYQQYLKATLPSEIPEEENIEESQVIDREYFRERVKNVVSLAENGELPEAESLADRILAEIGGQNPEPENYKMAVELYLDELLERCIAYPLSEEDQKVLSERHSALAAVTGPKEIQSYVEGEERRLLRMIFNYSRKNQYKYIDQAKEYIADHYMDSSLSLNEIGDHIGISASYLSELFNAVTHEKFTSYLASFRVEKARQLLHATKLTIKEIGFRCGFNSIQNFIRVFKKCTNQTPGQYRDSL